MDRLTMASSHTPLLVRTRQGAVAVGLLLLAACGETTAPASPQPSTPEVSVIPAQSQSVPITRELVGRLAPTRIAEVRARVAGIVLARAYSEGTDVKQGQVLFRIDPAPLEATLHAAQAALAQAKANATNAAATAKRYTGLASRSLASRQDLDNALASERTTAASAGARPTAAPTWGRTVRLGPKAARSSPRPAPARAAKPVRAATVAAATATAAPRSRN